MRTHSLLKALCVVLLLPAASAAAEPAVYKVDPAHSGVAFSIRHFVTNVPGRFKEFEGAIKYDKASPAASTVEFTVKSASIDTANNDRDEHLRSPDFFEVAKHPSWSFTSTKVAAKDADTLDVTGNLTIKGVTKQVTIPVEVLGTVATPRGEKAGFESSFTVNRKDFGITWNRLLDAGGAVLGDDVKITVTIEADRQQPAAATQ